MPCAYAPISMCETCATPACGQWRDTYIRVGEAQNPGPPLGAVIDGAVTFRSPEQRGFWHQSLPSPVDGQDGRENDDLFALAVDTVNATAWGPLSRYLLATSAHVLLCQEHHLPPRDVPTAAAFALRHGWQPIILPAEPGEGEGWRAGVAIFVRRFIGVGPPRVGGYEIIPARAIAALIEAPGYRPMTAVAIYLEHGKGIGAPNLQHMEALGLFLGSQGDHIPFIAGGDYQADPGELARLGFAQRTASSLVASRDPRGTCRSSTATAELDFFYIHNELTAGLRSVEVVEGAGTAPHLPVRATFHPRLTSARSLVLRRPPPPLGDRAGVWPIAMPAMLAGGAPQYGRPHPRAQAPRLRRG